MDASGRIRALSLQAYVAVMAILAVVVRLLPWRASISPRHVLFIQPDAYYHLRRATIMARNFPWYPTIDTYMAYPVGAEPPWPPLYDFVIAGISLVVGLGTPSERVIMLVTAFLPPVLAGLSVVPAFLLARELFGRRVGLVAAFFAVLMPGQLSYSVIGSGDHHVAEVLLATAYFFCLLKALRLAGVIEAPDAGGQPSEGEGAPWGSSRQAALWSGVWLGTSTLVWQGSMVFAAIGTAFASVMLFRSEDPRKRDACLRAGLTGLLTAAAMAAAGRGIIRPATPQTVFHFGFFSWFQPFFLISLGAALTGMYFLDVLRRRSGWGRARLAGGVALFVLAGLGIIAAVPGIRRNLLDSLVFLFRKHPYLNSINEFQPLIDRTPLAAGVSLPTLYNLLYLFGFFIPLFLCLRTLASIWKRTLRPQEVFFFIWTASFGALTLLQKRWANVYSANMAAGIGVFIVAFLDRTRIGQKFISEFLEWRRETGKDGVEPGILWKLVYYSRRFPRFYTAVAATLFFIPYYLFVYGLAFPVEPVMNPDAYNSFLWIRLNTPPTKNPWTPTETPEYAILAPWDLGHYIQYISERPTVANNFGYQLRGGGLEDSVRYLLAEDEDALVALCERRGVRYLVGTDVFGGLDTMAPIIGVDFVRDYTRPVVAAGHPGGDLRAPNEKFYSLVSQRMYVFDSSAMPETKALRFFRLVFESQNGPGSPHLPPETKFVKLFERVRGAKIIGRAAPGLPVTVSVRMMTNFDRFFDYVALTEADGSGKFELTVPYASQGTPYPVRAVSPYLAMTEREAAFFQVEEKDVAGGREVEVDLGKGMPAAGHPPVNSPSDPRPGGTRESP